MSRLLKATAIAVLFACSGSLHAQTDTATDESSHTIHLNKAQMAQETARRMEIIQRTQNLFTLLSAEMALQQGDINLAIATYLNTLPETKDPDVAERAMELAIDNHAYPIAELVYQSWRQIEPNPSQAQRRMALTRALALGDADTAMPELKSVLAQANDMQRRRLFLQLAQMSAVHPDFIAKGANAVHDAAQNYPDLAEAQIADVFYSSEKHPRRAIHALQRLAQLDKELAPATQLTLEVLAQKQPELFNQFFAQNSQKLPATWRQIQVNALIQAQRFNEARHILNELLADQPNAPLYIQAALLSYRMQDDTAVFLNYLEKAHQLGSNLEKSRTALLAAVRLIEIKQYQQALPWIKRIQAPELAYDKHVLLAHLASEQQQWTQAAQALAAAEKMPQKNGFLFNQHDVQRLKIYLHSQSQPPAKAVALLTRQLQTAQRLPDSADKTALISSILYQRALIYTDKLRQTAKAIADLRHFVALNPEDPTGLNALGYTLLGAHPSDYEEAFQLIQTAYRQNDKSPQINDSLGWAYHKKGDNQKALPYLEFAHQAEPNAEIAAHLGEVYWLLGRPNDARKIWRQGWQTDPNHPVLKETLQRYQIVF